MESDSSALAFDPRLFRWPDLPKAHYLLIFAGFDEAGAFQTREEAREEMDVILAAVNAVFGRNAGGDEVFELEVDLATGNYIASSQPMRVTFGESLVVTEQWLARIGHLFNGLDSLGVATQNRVILSLRWFAKALRERDLDAFIALWVAIETLAMPDTTNVKPATAGLAKAYDLDYASAAQRFQLGRIQGLRSDIVHNGRQVPSPDVLVEYLDAVYRDLLNDAVGMDPEHWIARFEQDFDFVVGDYLSNLPP